MQGIAYMLLAGSPFGAAPCRKWPSSASVLRFCKYVKQM